MASKRRIRNRACSRKKRHDTATAAKKEMNRLVRFRRIDDGVLHVYRCPWCSGWHVGHKPIQKSE